MRVVGAPACVRVCMRAHANVLFEVLCEYTCVNPMHVRVVYMDAFLAWEGGKYPNSQHLHAHFQHRRIVHVYVCIYMFVCACVCMRMHVLRAHVRVYHNPC